MSRNAQGGVMCSTTVVGLRMLGLRTVLLHRVADLLGLHRFAPRSRVSPKPAPHRPPAHPRRGRRVRGPRPGGRAGRSGRPGRDVAGPSRPGLHRLRLRCRRPGGPRRRLRRPALQPDAAGHHQPVPRGRSEAGFQVLQTGGHTFTVDGSNLLCSIDGYPATGCGVHNGDGTYDYWSYWYKTGTTWTYSSVGPAGRSPGDGRCRGLALRAGQQQPQRPRAPGRSRRPCARRRRPPPRRRR